VPKSPLSEELYDCRQTSQAADLYNTETVRGLRQSEGQSKSFQLADIAVLLLGTRDACPNCINRALLLRIILRKAVKQLIGFGTATFVR